MLAFFRKRLGRKINFALAVSLIAVMTSLTYYDYRNQRQIWLDNLAYQTHRDTLIIQAAISHTVSLEEMQHVIDAIGDNLNRGRSLTPLEHDQIDSIPFIGIPGPAEASEKNSEQITASTKLAQLDSRRTPSYEVFILDANSVVLASNYPELIGLVMDPAMTAAVLKESARYDTGIMRHMGHESHFGTLALFDEQEIQGAVHLAQPMTLVETNLKSFLNQRLLVFGALTGGLLLITSLVLTRLIVKPIQVFTRQIADVEAGDLSASIQFRGEDEIGRLGAAFNRTLTALQEAQIERQKVYDELEMRVDKRTADLQAANDRLRSEMIQRKQLEAEREDLLDIERKQRRLAETLARVGLAMSATLDLPELLDLICLESAAIFDVETTFIWLRQGEELIGIAGRGVGREQFIGMQIPMSDPVTLGARVVRETRPIFVNNAVGASEVNQELAEIFEIKSLLGVPLIKGEKAVGGLVVIDTQHPERFGPDDVQTASVFGSQAAAAIENAQLYEETQRRMRRLAALREIDSAITSSLDLRLTLKILLDQVIQTLAVHAADVLLLNHSRQSLEFAAGRGFHTGTLRHTRLRLGEGFAGRAALERRMISIPDLAAASGSLERSPQLPGEQFSSYYAVPLIAKGQVKGVLEVFHRELLAPQPEWMEFLETLADQAALAIDNASLFEGLQRSNQNLGLAYDSTLEGWAKALELRDRETEGHTQRVTELAIVLSEAVGLEQEELVHVRRGALLHDIGKMGVPDRILLKPGPLTEAEQETMRRHPEYAYAMLSPIEFLRPALDVPYCHHEKWDGTGYPRGLRAEQIPLAARIFAVADVWDALRSDRPYRKAWSDEKARAYILEHSGSHFDPQIVDAFLRVLPAVQREGSDMPALHRPL